MSVSGRIWKQGRQISLPSVRFGLSRQLVILNVLDRSMNIVATQGKQGTVKEDQS